MRLIDESELAQAVIDFLDSEKAMKPDEPKEKWPNSYLWKLAYIVNYPENSRLPDR